MNIRNRTTVERTDAADAGDLEQCVPLLRQPQQSAAPRKPSLPSPVRIFLAGTVVVAVMTMLVMLNLFGPTTAAIAVANINDGPSGATGVATGSWPRLRSSGAVVVSTDGLLLEKDSDVVDADPEPLPVLPPVITAQTTMLPPHAIAAAAAADSDDAEI